MIEEAEKELENEIKYKIEQKEKYEKKKGVRRIKVNEDDNVEYVNIEVEGRKMRLNRRKNKK